MITVMFLAAFLSLLVCGIIGIGVGRCLMFSAIVGFWAWVIYMLIVATNGAILGFAAAGCFLIVGYYGVRAVIKQTDDLAPK